MLPNFFRKRDLSRGVVRISSFLSPLLVSPTVVEDGRAQRALSTRNNVIFCMNTRCSGYAVLGADEQNKNYCLLAFLDLWFRRSFDKKQALKSVISILLNLAGMDTRNCFAQ